MRATDAKTVGVIEVARAAFRIRGVGQAIGVVITVGDADAVAGLRLRVAVVIVGVAGDLAIDRFRLGTAANGRRLSTKSERWFPRSPSRRTTTKGEVADWHRALDCELASLAPKTSSE
ncbi:MAG TPA: hypothetical protein P5307_05240 [Pirellulaceae bacterium]|nr:hypothetical protein [Pirellulaceae bacterium]